MTILSHPSQMNAATHQQVLSKLRSALEGLKSSPAADPGIQFLRIRDWSFVTVSGRPCLRIVLDSPQGITLDECMEYHRWLLESPALDDFSDEITIEVGSPGPEPALRDLEDFEAALGLMVSVETWSKLANRNKYVMILEEVRRDADGPVLVLKEGPHQYAVPWSEIKTAKALPNHPASPQKRRTGLGKQKGRSPRLHPN